MTIEGLTKEYEEVQKSYPECINCNVRLTCSICQLYTEWLEQKLTHPCARCERIKQSLGRMWTWEEVNK